MLLYEIDGQTMSATNAVGYLMEKLAAVTQERNDLIAGAIEREESFIAVTAELAARTPQWKDAPPWATCAKMDANGAWTWFAVEPRIYMDYWDATVGYEQYAYFDKWQELHMERPKGE